MSTALAVAEPRHPTLRHPQFITAFERVLDKRIRPDQFLEVVASAMYANPELEECTKVSLYSAICTAARDGLLPTGRDGGGWLIPRRVNVAKKGQKPKYEKQAHFQSSYVGELSRVRRVFMIKRLVVECVYEGDRFDHQPSNLDQPIVHQPNTLTRDEEAELIGVYAIAVLEGDQRYHAVLNRADIERIKASSDGAKSDYSPWKKHEPEMWKKSALRRIVKIMPRERADVPFSGGDDDPVVIDVGPTRDARPVLTATTGSDEDDLVSKLRGSVQGTTVVEDAREEDDAEREPGSDG